jgi:hypothetical protein
MNTETEKNAKAFIVIILCIGYGIGTITHIIHLTNVIRLGFTESSTQFGVSPIVNGYWLVLTVIDPIILTLLIVKARLGAILGTINILVNVAVNSSNHLYKFGCSNIRCIYDAMGDLYISVQIAFLLFSAISLPIILNNSEISNKSGLRAKDVFSAIPIAILLIGLSIHAIGIIALFSHPFSLWNVWVHISMVIVDSLLIIGLLNRLKLGYFIGLTGFILFGLLQAGFGIATFIGYRVGFNFAQALTIAFCSLAIAALILQRDLYSQSVYSLLNRTKCMKKRTRAEEKRIDQIQQTTGQS